MGLPLLRLLRPETDIHVYLVHYVNP